MSKQLLLNELKKQENRSLDYQNRRLEKANEEFRKVLSNKDEKITRLKGHNQNLEDKIRKSKNDEESPYGSNDNLEEEIKCIRKLIMDKDNELAQV